MPRHLPLVLSAVALVVALLGVTPLGEAARQSSTGAGGPMRADVGGYQVVVKSTASNSVGNKFIGAVCPAGKVVLGGGAQTSPAGAGVPVALNNSYRAGIGWYGGAKETAPTAVNWLLSVVAICAN
ncbi:MAG: hypothetical protein ABWY51_08395 [Gaiellaceae bacterium]|jgi:hypothetical protein